MLQDNTVIAVNLFGSTMFAFYSLFYYFMTRKHRRRVLAKILLTIATVSAIVFFSVVMSSDPVFFSGIFACLGSLTFCASPLIAIKHVIRTKSTDCLPFHLILFGFAVSSLWTSYGILIDNNFVIIPNALSSLISGFQLSLFIIYRKSLSKPKRVSQWFSLQYPTPSSVANTPCCHHFYTQCHCAFCDNKIKSFSQIRVIPKGSLGLNTFSCGSLWWHSRPVISLNLRTKISSKL